jgi:hypothetical protein
MSTETTGGKVKGIFFTRLGTIQQNRFITLNFDAFSGLGNFNNGTSMTVRITANGNTSTNNRVYFVAHNHFLTQKKTKHSTHMYIIAQRGLNTTPVRK